MWISALGPKITIKTNWFVVYFKYFVAEKKGPRKKYKNIFGVYGGNVLKFNGLRKLRKLYHAAISANFKTVLMKHHVV